MDLLKPGAIVAFALSTVSIAACAGNGAAEPRAYGEPARGAAVSFEEADIDNSGFVDATEASELGLDVLAHDVNKNGVIDRVEWERGPGTAAGTGAVEEPRGADEMRETRARSAADMAGVTFEEADLDDSGFVDATEAKELDLDVVEFDTNYNGIIDRIEWERAPTEATEPDAAEREERPRAETEVRESEVRARSAVDMTGVSFQEADLDDSGFVDATEAKEHDLDVVDFDTNYNGIIDRIEWERAPEEATESEK